MKVLQLKILFAPMPFYLIRYLTNMVISKKTPLDLPTTLLHSSTQSNRSFPSPSWYQSHALLSINQSVRRHHSISNLKIIWCSEGRYRYSSRPTALGSIVRDWLGAKRYAEALSRFRTEECVLIGIFMHVSWLSGFSAFPGLPPATPRHYRGWSIPNKHRYPICSYMDVKVIAVDCGAATADKHQSHRHINMHRLDPRERSHRSNQKATRGSANTAMVFKPSGRAYTAARFMLCQLVDMLAVSLPSWPCANRGRT